MNTTYIFYIIAHIQISLVRNFSSNWQFWFFGPNLTTKVFPVKNWKTEHHQWILHIQISLGTKFPLKLTIFIFWTKFAQKGISSRNRKSEDDHGILHIWISLGAKFQPKLIIFSFRPRLPKKGISSRKQNKQSKDCVVNVNSTSGFEHFENLKDLIILNILKKNLVLSCLQGNRGAASLTRC